MRNAFVLLIFVLTAAGLAGRELAYVGREAVLDSLRTMPRWEQVRWLAERGLPDPFLQASVPDDSGPLRCVGRWSYGPSRDIEVRATDDDTILFLSRGSGVSIVRFRSHDSLTLDLLSDINSSSLTGRVTVRDSMLYVGSGGVEFYDISDLASPELLGSLSLAIYDYFIKDTLCYTISRESLAVYSVADPANPYLVGACRDSGYALFVAGSHAYIGDQYGLYVIDVSDPAAPHRVSSLGHDVISIWVRDSLLCFGTYDSTFRTYSVADPTAPQPLGTLRNIQPADLYMPPTCDTVVYAQSFAVVSVSQPGNPRIIGSASPPGWEYGVAAVPGLNCALVADYFDGLAVVDITTPQTPTLDTLVFNAGLAEDLVVDGNRLYVAGLWSGLHVIDISDPAAPHSLGNVDIPGTRPSSYAVAARDSFAYIGWTPVPQFRSVLVADPTRPELVGGCGVANYPEDMVLRDTLVYAAELGRLQVVNVARPREPELVGTCMLSGYAGDLAVVDTFAYLSHDPFTVVNVARPDNPIPLGTWGGRNHGVDAVDTIVYAAGPYTGLVALSVSNPSAPYVLDSLYLEDWWNDVTVNESLAFVGGTRIQTIDVSNPRGLRVLGTWTPPYLVKRIEYEAPYVYAACLDAGVCVLETVMTGLAEQRGRLSMPLGLSLRSSITGATALLEVSGLQRGTATVCLYDAAGRELTEHRVTAVNGKASWELKLTGLPVGVYLVSVRGEGRGLTAKVVKAGR